ncbi:MAG: tRNA (adenosine(37)-N6)-threonylcarbamoyltransferase complex dimerization subunit type 1 TsaB [Deltaproteobacteria bacterium]|nr:tRNA (adenosine(37)-N6)-threonylcarbamoyltransferase complex dimerization subunit type 1 TsaB [Deltaproteobacteria bacterium]MBN2687891.1 tRNA (adenosine(37)-N6)-threonylcarbamoyltransferase complex dimerization subunit type 1 TsaB [Deltaproteobacteria bacterium]
MITLAFDTSTKTGSFALLKDKILLVEQFMNTGRNHGETVHPAIRQILSAAGIGIGDVNLLAVTVGPGSFTGLRIGAGTAKGLAFAEETLIVGVSTLDALAANASGSALTICPMLDARKGEVYTAFYRAAGADFPERISDERVISPEILLTDMDRPVLFLGDGAIAYEGLIRSILADKAHFVPDPFNYIRAASVGLIGLKKFRDGDSLNSLIFAPRYLRLSEAETRKLTEGNGGDRINIKRK